MGGQDQAKGKIIRIGHMGYIENNDMVETMYRLSLALKDLNFAAEPERIKLISQEWLRQN